MTYFTLMTLMQYYKVQYNTSTYIHFKKYDKYLREIENFTDGRRDKQTIRRTECINIFNFVEKYEKSWNTFENTPRVVSKHNL